MLPGRCSCGDLGAICSGRSAIQAAAGPISQNLSLPGFSVWRSQVFVVTVAADLQSAAELKSVCVTMSAIVLIFKVLNLITAHAAGFRSPLRVRGKIGLN